MTLKVRIQLKGACIINRYGFKVIESSLRGRPLHGINLKLADNQIGLVVADKTESGKRELKLESTFDHISSWQLDEPEISQNTEPLCRAINEWFAVSEIVRPSSSTTQNSH